MSQNKKTSKSQATKPAKPSQKNTQTESLSSKKESPVTDPIKVVTKSSGVSPIGAVFLSLLTMVAVGSGIFAFRDKLTPYVQDYFTVTTTEASESLTPPPGFVPVPAATNTPPSISAEASSRIDELKQQQMILASQLNEIQATLTRPPTDSTTQHPDIAELNATLESTQTQLAESMARIITLETKLKETQSLATALANKPEVKAPKIDVRGLIAFQSLQNKALSGQKFQADLQRVIALLDDTSGIEEKLAKLEEMASIGRPSLEYLQKEFKSTITGSLQSAQTADNTFIGKVKQNIGSFVRVRRTDGTGDANDVSLASAEKALSDGDVKKAYTELLKLDEAAKKPFAQWLLHARAHYQLPEWLEALQLELSNTLQAES